jgi:hypothetical protein
VTITDRTHPFFGRTIPVVRDTSSKRPHGLFAGITGVIRSHRRRRIATALKLCSIRYAQENGFTTIYTDNEENNPMFQLNLELGFKPLPAWTFYEKNFAEAFTN